MSYCLAVLLLLLAAGLRMCNLTSLPVGVSDDEQSMITLMEDRTKQGDIQVFYDHEGRGREGFYPNILGIFTLWYGSGTLTYRIVSVWLGMLHIALTYSLGTRLVGRIGGLAAAGLITVMMLPNLLARSIVTEAAMPMLITAILLMLARTMPVYSRMRTQTRNTIDFATLGALLGLSLYVHPASLLLILGAMIFIGFVIVTQRPLPLIMLSYTGFAILMTLIVSMPYFLSTIRLPLINANTRIIGGYESITSAFVQGLLSIGIQGDLSPLHNLPERPLVDLISAFFIVLGLLISLWYWRKPRYTLLLIVFVALSPAAFLVKNAPNFTAISILLPMIAIFFAIGVSTTLYNITRYARLVGLAFFVGLFAYNLLWTGRDLFVQWPAREDVNQIYNANLGQLVHYIDTTAGTIPTTMCHPGWDQFHFPGTPRDRAEWVLLLMNRDPSVIRFFDCRQSFVFTNGGTQQQVIFPQPLMRQILPPLISNWIDAGEDRLDVPDNTVVMMQVEEQLADALGLLTTTAPASYVNDADVSDRVPVPPPIRFGGNVTWLGYLPPAEEPTYRLGQSVSVTTYWRIEGLVPADLRIFTHILSDPVTIASNRDAIYIDPTTIQERDVFLQITNIPLSTSLLPTMYEISIGVYQNSSDDRLPVFGADGEPRGNRIFLYDIQVTE